MLHWLSSSACNVKIFPSHKVHRVVLIFVFSALSHIPVYTARPQIGG